MTIPDVDLIDLTWVQFSEEEADPCEILEGCSKEATWTGKYEWPCGCLPEVRDYCENHGSLLWAEWVAHPFCVCMHCGTPVNLISMDRKTK